MRFTVGNYDFRVSTTARKPWTSFKIHTSEIGKHLVWGKLSASYDNWALEVHPICAECGSSEIGESGELTVCQACRSVEQGYRYVNLREFEGA